MTHPVTTRNSHSSQPPTANKPPLYSGKVRRFLRALGHELEPVVHVGKTGVSRGVRLELEQALLAHELIKVRLLRECPVDRATAGEVLSSNTGSAHIQTLGGVVLLYRARPEEPRIVLPGTEPDRSVAPRVTKRKGAQPSAKPH
jgi:RNA-binding protein